ncbi:MAG: exodeoxyribonuclease V subunit gamma, partial [Gracilimonas sp.]|nr:exodeoxyribonuclease V subunit gamma [Gracilimonas sp.]
MIHLHQSSSLASLAGTFQTVTDSQDSKNPLEPTWVIVQNNEIKEWLSLQVAKKKGISGNFQFIFPSEFLWNLYRLIDGDIPKQLPSDLNAMHWTLFELFLDEPDLLNKVPFAQKEQKNTMQLFYLSAQLADVFDQYQVYRPQMLLGWLDQNFVTGHKDERWQADVWNRLNSYWQKHEEMQSIPSRAMAYKNLSQWLMEGKKSLYAKLPKDLYVFGLSQYSKPLIKILVLLGREIEVSLFRRKSQNAEKEGLSESILHKWSKPYHDQENLIQVLAKQAMTKVKFFDHPNSDTHKPQISINSCHSARREVQVLKDSILHYLSDKSGSKPEDILIMIPDESKYAPLLKAEFSGDADSDEINLPISQLYDRQHIEEHTLVQILELLGATFKPSSMLGLLNLTPIKNTFSFSDDELEILENWISESNAFRGIGDHFNTPYSWNKALNQMIAGFSMEADEMEIFKGLVPLQGIHSSDLMELAGRFSSFMNSIAHLYQEVQKNKKALEWVDFIEQ